MKKILITIRLVLVSLLANATHQSSQLSLTTSQNKKISVSIDQSPLSNRVKLFMVDRIEPGYHYLYVVSHSRFHYGPKHVELLYNNYIYIPASSKITATICHDGVLNILNVVPICANTFPVNPPINCNNYQNSYALSSYAPMCDNEFNRLIDVIASKAFESTKLKIAKQAILSNHFIAYQVTGLMQQMSFESSRLELAKIAYKNTIDKQNYFRVNDSFYFESSIRELDRFILTDI